MSVLGHGGLGSAAPVKSNAVAAPGATVHVPVVGTGTSKAPISPFEVDVVKLPAGPGMFWRGTSSCISLWRGIALRVAIMDSSEDIYALAYNVMYM